MRREGERVREMEKPRKIDKMKYITLVVVLCAGLCVQSLFSFSHPVPTSGLWS